MHFSTIDIFCHVIDNFGDAGTVYRFATELLRNMPSVRIRVFIDDLSPLMAMNPQIQPDLDHQEARDISYFDFTRLSREQCSSIAPAEILMETYACEIPGWYLEKALFSSRLIINLESLSAEQWVEGYHLKESLLPGGTARKFYFMPGFTPATGGLLFNSSIQAEKEALVNNRYAFISSLLERTGCSVENPASMLIGSVFTYRRSFDALLRDAATLDREVLLLCSGEKTQTSLLETLKRQEYTATGSPPMLRWNNVTVVLVPFIAQSEYDRLLCCTDFNFVRGEDSWVQAIAAGKPFIWNAYIQDEQYQQVKVEAFNSFSSRFFDNNVIRRQFGTLLKTFNNVHNDASDESPDENYLFFFRNLETIEKGISNIYFYLRQNRNLVENFLDFILHYHG